MYLFIDRHPSKVLVKNVQGNGRKHSLHTRLLGYPRPFHHIRIAPSVAMAMQRVIRD